MRKVSIHAPARGATRKRCSVRNPHSFNSRAREGRDKARIYIFSAIVVSIHAPARGATKFSNLNNLEISFNSRAREGRDGPVRLGCGYRRVSIHAPARGATNKRLSNQPADLFQFTRPRGARLWSARPRASTILFQFTRPRGARRALLFRALPAASFNSRAREGRDKLELVILDEAHVSIHAPARGATGDQAQRNAHAGFNSRAREGRDRGRWLG